MVTFGLDIERNAAILLVTERNIALYRFLKDFGWFREISSLVFQRHPEMNHIHGAAHLEIQMRLGHSINVVGQCLEVYRA